MVGLPEGVPVEEHAAPGRTLAVAALAVGAWSLLPPYVGPALATEARVEFADHVVPGITVITVAAASLGASTRRAAPTLLFLAGLGVILAGFWMTATHVPLVLQATRGEAPWGATAYHSLPGLAVLAVGGLWSARFWSEDATHEESHQASSPAPGSKTGWPPADRQSL